MTDKEKIIAEIERRTDELYKELPDASKVLNGDISTTEANITGKYTALESLLLFINSLPEEPISDNLDDAAKSYGDEKEKKAGCGTEFTTGELIKAFKAGSKWDYDKLIEKACDAYCEVCGHYAHTVPTHVCRNDCDYYSRFKKIITDD